MTEEEAKTKWCPFARAAIGWIEINDDPFSGAPKDANAVAASVNRGNGISDPCLCIGSACMAWRERYDEGVSFPPTGGYCGLAGKP